MLIHCSAAHVDVRTPETRSGSNPGKMMTVDHDIDLDEHPATHYRSSLDGIFDAIDDGRHGQDAMRFTSPRVFALGGKIPQMDPFTCQPIRRRCALVRRTLYAHSIANCASG